MALSNIFNEPRREITETLLGIVVMIIPASIVYWIASYYRTLDHTMPFVLSLVLAFLSVGIGVFVFAVLAIFTHFVGELVCDALERTRVSTYVRESDHEIQLWS